MKQPTLFLDDGSEVELPSKWQICSACDGHGKSSAYLGAYTQDDMAEAGREFMEEYMAGGYDRACDACDGEGKVKVADLKAMSPKQRRQYRAQVRDDAECAAIERMERMMGA